MIGNDWDKELEVIWNSPNFQKIYHQVLSLYDKETIYPPKEDIFRALKLTPYNKVKVVIMGQDPYHGEGEAMGLSFSVHKGIKLPPSLKNIYKEIYDDIGIIEPECGDLTKWANEGVLLLNSVLTVKKDTPASHKNIGWEPLTDYIIKKLNARKEPVVFILWGNFAKSKAVYITNPQHLVLTSAHPSPFSCRYGFFGSRPFSKTNEFLKKNGIEPVDWQL